MPYELEAPLLYSPYDLGGTAARIEPCGDEDIRIQYDPGTWHVTLVRSKPIADLTKITLYRHS